MPQENYSACRLVAEAADFFLLFLLGRRGGRDGGDGPERNKSLRRLRLLQNLLAVELGHTGVLGRLLQLVVAHADLLFAGVLGDALVVEIVLQSGRNSLRIENQRVLRGRKVDLLPAGEDLMPAVLFVPLG